MPSSLDEEVVKARIEAALYAAGRPLGPEELAKAAGITSKKRAVGHAHRLAKFINSVMKAVEIAELEGQRFVMQLKPEFNTVAKKFATHPLLSFSALKTLSYVVYLQPITAMELARRRGSSAYDHAKALEQLGFISAEPSGRTKVYTTTPAFSEYFGLSADPQVMKRQLARFMTRKP